MPIFETPDPIAVELDVEVGDVHVVASDRSDTTVEVRPNDPSSAADVKAAEGTRVDLVNGRLLVAVPKQRGLARFSWKTVSVDITVEVPAGSDLRWDSAAGDIRCDGTYGTCRLATSAGRIRLDHAAALKAKTSAGDVSVESVVGDAEVTGGGELRIGEVGGAAEVKNLNGDTWIGTAQGPVRCNSDNGAIVVDRAAAGVDARTANGSVRVHEVVRGVVVLKTAYGSLEVGIRPGTAALLDVRSQYGKVRNELEAAAGPEPTDETVEVRARTSFGDITIHRAQPANLEK